MASNALAAALVEDYESLGYGERISETEIRSLDGSTVLSLESGEESELLIFVNGDHLDTLSYSDGEFNKRLLTHVAGALNI